MPSTRHCIRVPDGDGGYHIITFEVPQLTRWQRWKVRLHWTLFVWGWVASPPVNTVDATIQPEYHPDAVHQLYGDLVPPSRKDLH